MSQSPSSFARGVILLTVLLSAHHPTVTHASAAHTTSTANRSELTQSRPAPCETLGTVALPNAKITKAERVEAGAFVAPPLPPGPPVSVDYSTLPAFCRVAATASPTPDSAIKFEVWMPVQGWNGKFVAVGNGGFAGMIFYFAMAEPLRRGYAVAGSDTGHEGGPADASFAVGHPEKLVDYAWRAVHEMTVKSKALVTTHYSVPPRRSYWVGCSSGGRQGLKEAQRFPDDFDGISAGFMVPGVDHCSGGEGTFQIGELEAIDTWVESGKAPEQLVASRPLAGGARRTRPLCPYPQVARYRGQGSTDEANNFACEPPRPR